MFLCVHAYEGNVSRINIFLYVLCMVLLLLYGPTLCDVGSEGGYMWWFSSVYHCIRICTVYVLFTLPCTFLTHDHAVHTQSRLLGCGFGYVLCQWWSEAFPPAPWHQEYIQGGSEWAVLHLLCSSPCEQLTKAPGRNVLWLFPPLECCSIVHLLHTWELDIPSIHLHNSNEKR